MVRNTTVIRNSDVLLPVILLSVLLAGCFEVRQELWIGTEGGDRLRYTISTPSPIDPTSATSPLPVEAIHDLGRRLRGDVRLRFSPRIEQYVADGRDHIALELAVHDRNDLSAVNRAIIDMAGGDDALRASLARLFDFTLEEDLEGIIRYRQRRPETAVRRAREIITDERFRPDRQAARGSLVIILHSPVVSSTSGSRRRNDTEVRWSLELGDLMAGQENIRSFEAEIGPASRGSRLWQVIGIVLVVSMLAGIITWIRHSRRRVMGPGDPIR
jgi:hypothetical protein